MVLRGRWSGRSPDGCERTAADRRADFAPKAVARFLPETRHSGRLQEWSSCVRTACRQTRTFSSIADQPLNVEPPLAKLAETFITDQHDLYIRTHGEVQQLDEGSYRLRVAGDVQEKLQFSLVDLQARFAMHTITCSLQCAGNRRADLQEVAETAGDPWQGGAIGNVRWTGVALREVLEAAGVAADERLQVAFYSPDEIEVEGERGRFGVSIPLEKAMSDHVLLAYEMNGEPLSPEHGYPLRAVVPGYAGVRSAKWLTEIRIQAEPADSPIQRKDYKLFPASVCKEDVDWDAGLTIDAMPLNACICQPAGGAELASGPVTIKGWATASERRVKRVDVSTDGGRHWALAELEQADDQPHAWTLWRLDTVLEKGEHELVVRAWDEAMQTQPEAPDDTWNFAGYLAAHRHHVRVSVTLARLRPEQTRALLRRRDIRTDPRLRKLILGSVGGRCTWTEARLTSCRVP